MSVIKFPSRQPPMSQCWQSAEFQPLLSACEGSISTGEASGWEIGATDDGDPQLYILGPAPSYECILCVSRLGRTYLIEDGRGQILFELDSPLILAERALAALRRHKSTILARVVVACCALRETIREKADALTAEPMELLTHIAPVLA